MIEITAEIRALIDKAAVGMELAGDEYIDPVSYTHLDVYKRQILMLTERRVFALYKILYSMR